MKTYKLNLLGLLLLLGAASCWAQTEKLNRTLKANNDVIVEIDATHTNILVEPWDRNEVKVEAFLISEEASAEELKNWKLSFSGDARKVVIKSNGSAGLAPMPPLPDLESIAKVPEMVAPLMEMVGPLLESISNNPLPPQFHEKMGNLQFDFEAYQKEGEKYMERWEKQVEENFGEDFERSMEEWATRFERDSLLWQKDLEHRMEAWGEEFGKSMEQWGENFGKNIEQWASNFEAQMEGKPFVQLEGIPVPGSPSKALRTIKIMLPKKAGIVLKVRHGEVDLEGRTNNLKGEVSHGIFSAGIISGEDTNVKFSYTPIKIREWEHGVLNTSYIKKAEIGKVKSLKLVSNSSDMKIGEIQETAIIEGTFGKLEIQKIGAAFRTVDIALENSDLELKLPDTALKFNYNGAKSKIEYPSSIKSTPVKSYDNEIINGFHQSNSGSGLLNIKAKFSRVNIK